MKRPLCPILTIGFAPPEEGKRDMRRCSTECAMYDESEEQCSIKTCAEMFRYISGQVNDLGMIAEGFIPFEDDDTFEYNPNTISA